MTTTISAMCPKCGTIEKSGQVSCCGRGGSWFKNCGGSGNTQLDYTWSEGIQACNAWLHSKAIIGQQPHNAQQRINSFSFSADIVISTFSMITASTPANMSIVSARTATSMSITTRVCDNLLKIVVYTTLVLVITIQC